MKYVRKLERFASTAIKNFKFTNSQGDTIQYSGEVSNGLPNGQGTGIFFDTSEESYTGTWINGVPNGYGTMKVSQPNGSKFVYTGQISNGQANGQGTLSFTQGPHKGDSYFGPFKNNNFHTEGMFLTVQCYEVQFLSKTQILTKPVLIFCIHKIHQKSLSLFFGRNMDF